MENGIVYVLLSDEAEAALNALAKGCSPEAAAGALLDRALENPEKLDHPDHPLTFRFPDETLDACRDVLAVLISANRDKNPSIHYCDGVFALLRMVEDALEYEADANRKWSGTGE